MKDSAKIWYSIRRGTLRIALAAFAACAAATVPANVVRNDLVTATSDAELETSDKGMGLGINVVGGGDAVITLETRPGWRFRDGSTTFTMNKLAGVKATSPEIVNEGSTAESGGEIVADETEKTEEEEEGGVEHVPPEVEISVDAVPTAAAYALPANSATVAFELSASVKSDAEHWETDKNGNKTKGPETFSPDEYVWKAVASNTVTAACVEWSTTSSGKSVTGALQLGKGAWKVTFSVYAKATCSTCNETVESAEDDEVRTVTVYEVSINRPDYLGLDQTDAGRKGHTVKDATLVTDPEYVGLDDNAVTWTACGELCEFKDENGVAKSKGEKVNYRNKGADNASKSLNAEPLTAKVSIPGAEDVYCTTNFTVVKVDVSIGGTGEGGDETAPQNVIYSRELTKFAITNMTPVKVTCEPKSLPGMELVWLTLPDNVELFELGEDGTAKSAKSYYRYNEIGGKSFGLLGRPSPTETADGWAPEFKGGYVVAEHYSSEAKDKANVKVVPPPLLEITDVQFLSPNTKKNGAWPYDPVWDNPDYEPTVNGSVAAWCADNPGDTKVRYTLSRDAEKVSIEFLEGGIIPSDPIQSLQGSVLSGVNEKRWGIPKDLDEGKYFAKVVAVELETGEERAAKSNNGKLVRECYYKSDANETEYAGVIHKITQKEIDDFYTTVTVAGVGVGNWGVGLLVKSNLLGVLISTLVAVEFAHCKLPNWYLADSSIFCAKWPAYRYEWKGCAYGIGESETVLPSEGGDGHEKASIFEMGIEAVYRKYAKPGINEADFEEFYSTEWKWVNPATGVRYKSQESWIWDEKPLAGYGLNQPKIVYKTGDGENE